MRKRQHETVDVYRFYRTESQSGAKIRRLGGRGSPCLPADSETKVVMSPECSGPLPSPLWTSPNRAKMKIQSALFFESHDSLWLPKSKGTPSERLDRENESTPMRVTPNNPLSARPPSDALAAMAADSRRVPITFRSQAPTDFRAWICACHIQRLPDFRETLSEALLPEAFCLALTKTKTERR